MEIDLTTRHGQLKARFNPPAGEMRLAEFVFNLFPLEERLIGMGVREAQKEGRAVSCRSGCGACCRQPVPVSMPEAFLLYELVAGQPREKREMTLARFEAAREVLHAKGFGERSIAGEDQNQFDVVGLALDYFKLSLPCPLLESESCSIHAFRPMGCREHLVTSPAEHCSNPAERHGDEIHYNVEIRPVLAPVSMTQALAMLHAQLEAVSPIFIPLALALDYAAENREGREKKYESERLFSLLFATLEPLARSRIGATEPKKIE